MTTPYLTPPVFSWPAAPGGKLHTYLAGGVTPQVTYSDAAGVTPNTNPVTLDSLGSAVVRLAVGVAYHFVLKEALDVTTLWDADNYDNAYLTSGTITAVTIGTALYPQTQAETNASVVPTNYAYAPGNMLRYGLVPNSSAAAAANTVACQALWKSSIANGPQGRFDFPNTTGADIYYFNDILDLRDGVQIYGNNCTLSFTKLIPTAHDIDAGCLFGVRNIVIRDLTLSVTYPSGSGGAQFSPLTFGVRGNDGGGGGTGTYFPNSYDSLLSAPQGNITVKNVRILNNTSKSFAVWLTGGLQDVTFEDVWIDGSNNATITGITVAASAVVTVNTVSTSNPFAVGQGATFVNVLGMTQINGLNGTISAIGGFSGAWTATLSINSSAFSAYTSGGTMSGFSGDGIYCEYGWATNEAAPSARQTSHPHNLSFKNIHMKNLTIAVGSAGGLQLTGVYNVFVDGLYVSNAYLCCSFTVGESAFFRPWLGVDDVGAKHNITLYNVRGRGLMGPVGMQFVGCTSFNQKQGVGGAGTPLGYLGQNWVQNTAYVLRQTAYSANSGNIYVCSQAGTSSGAGTGPTGTGTGIVDGTAKWDYVPLTIFVDLGDFTVDNFSLDCSGINNNGNGITCSAGRIIIRNGTITANSAGQAWTHGIQLFDECTNFVIENTRIIGNNQSGIKANFGTGMSNVPPTSLFTPQRLKSGSIRLCYIAGNSVSSAGTYEAIGINNCDGVLIEGNRIGYDSAYTGGTAETTQGIPVFLSSLPTCSNVIVRGNHIGGWAAGTVYSFQQTIGAGVTAQGNTLSNNTGINTSFGIFKDANDASKTMAYTASITPDVSDGTNHFIITAINGTAFTINAPINNALAISANNHYPYGRKLRITIHNTSGGALGAVTWNAIYKQAWVSPATGFQRSIEFFFDGTNLIEISHSPADVPN